METVTRFSVGDKVCWRSGKSKTRRHLPLGIAGCTILEFGETPDKQEAAKLMLPWVKIGNSVIADALVESGIPKDGTCWALIADLEAENKPLLHKGKPFHTDGWGHIIQD